MTLAFVERSARVYLIAGALFTAACGEDATQAPPPPPRPAMTVPAPGAAPGAATAVTAPAAVTAPLEYTYDVSLRDPFVPVSPQPHHAGEDVECGPLCQYDISQFRINGIVWGISQPAAMLRAPDGKPYIVKVGTPLGRNKGKVVSITKDRIAVLEKYVNYRGEVVTNRVDIELPSEGGTRK